MERGGARIPTRTHPRKSLSKPLIQPQNYTKTARPDHDTAVMVVAFLVLPKIVLAGSSPGAADEYPGNAAR